ncbi:D-glycero-beta-D-manno-heptose 1-phosphate adenylyltransferase [Actinoalloteichus caeruleus]|uniref:Bifunctional protein HldE n=1 Tax=Actinoalloteichus caeruleus DSM 43889 TaxID=1120930 RepID=A0ABT1JBL9_ACTCY|nr:D-glycero-beta-D-manno-heptose 1-phosphate adenylyltransferase [Actinoalloteichus caeruleus]MCP2329838.1 rfaE bifunctional protein, domain I/rfaE bifunctional protein, domain II [Actinoalloteichus caeruleus DSM 43889]
MLWGQEPDTTLTVGPTTPGLLAGRRPRVLVLGDVLVDVWLSGTSRRLCREAPAPVVEVERTTTAPGGAGNTAANLAALGAAATLLAVTGDDPAGRALRAALTDRGVNVRDLVSAPGGRTMTKSRLICGDQLLARFDDGDQADPPAATTRELASLLADLVPDHDALLVCDYGLGVAGPPLRDAVAALREEVPLLIVDSHDPAEWAATRPDVVTPNAQEAASLLGAGGRGRRLAHLQRHRDRILRRTRAGAVVVTLDRDGSVLFSHTHPEHRTWARPVPDCRAAGAGDTYVAALTAGLASGLPLTGGMELAQAAADVVVAQPGTCVCGPDQLASRLGDREGEPVGREQLAAVVRRHRDTGRRIVFTNGCFDVLHRGHLAYLAQAKQLGDVLVVAVNSDASVARLKGPDRPVNPENDRAAVVAGLSCVDHVTVFDGDTPVELLRLLRPDVYAKGGDYTPEMLPETPVVRGYGGEVRLLDYVPDRSTTALITRIRANADRVVD